MDQTVKLLQTLTPQEGENASFLPDVSFYKASSFKRCETLITIPRLIILVQGAAIAKIGGATLQYNQDSCLLLSVPTGLTFETQATTKKPLLEIDINLNSYLFYNVLRKFVSHTDDTLLNKQGDLLVGIKSISLSIELKHAVSRLLEILQSQEQTAILGDGALTEVLYFVLKEQPYQILLLLNDSNSDYSHIFKILDYIGQNYAQELSMKKLSEQAAMSESKFYKTFKKATLRSPLQYVKSIRLGRARQMILSERMNLSQIASKVGYKSVSQFSREFKRYFGENPKDIR